MVRYEDDLGSGEGKEGTTLPRRVSADSLLISRPQAAREWEWEGTDKAAYA